MEAVMGNRCDTTDAHTNPAMIGASPVDVPFELAADFEIEARPEHEPRLLAMLRFLLVNREQPAPFAVREDPTRRGFYDIESEGRV